MQACEAGVMARLGEIVARQMPERADGFMQVPLDYYRDLGIAARERHLFMTKPRPIVASSEIAAPDDYLVRESLGRSLLATRDQHGQAHDFLN